MNCGSCVLFIYFYFILCVRFGLVLCYWELYKLDLDPLLVCLGWY